MSHEASSSAGAAAVSPASASPYILEARDVRKVFTGQVTLEVLRGISVGFPAGQFAAIVGPSGSGKSTLLYILGALDRASSGEVLVRGQNVMDLDEARLARLRNTAIGFVFQFHFLLPEFTALENVMMPALIGGAERGELEKRALELLDRVGLSGRARQRSTRLSGGEQQRVAVARALINRPAIVLCDEPTGNLDSRNSQAVFDLFRELNRENGQTIVVVTHDTDFARRTDRIVRLVDGVIDLDRRT